jgi:predicted amidohydrolase
MTARYSISVAQTCPVRGDVERNLEEHLRLVRLAAERGAGVLVFPELSLTGYELDLAERLAMSPDDPRLATVADAARSSELTVIVGAPVRLESGLHIAAIVVLPDGSRSVYTKHRLGAFGESARCDGTLPPPEPDIFRPGALEPLVPLDDGVAAVAICADIGLASHPQRAADRGARTYLASMFVIPSEFEQDSARLRRYASEHSLRVAFANFGASTGGLAAAGRSSIWSERGELLVELPAAGAGIAVAARTSDGWRCQLALLDPAPKP